MKRIILIIFAIVAVAGMAVLAMTKPDRAAHYQAVKMQVLKVVDHSLSGNPVTAEYTVIGTLKALDMIDEYLQRNLLLHEHMFYTTGILIYKDMLVPISIGVLGQVYLTIDDEDMKKVEDLFTSSRIIKSVGSVDFNDN
jgi:hypothetical protein